VNPKTIIFHGINRYEKSLSENRKSNQPSNKICFRLTVGMKIVSAFPLHRYCHQATLRALLGENAKGLSAQTVSRLKIQWKDEFETRSKGSIRNKKYVDVWADGVYFTPRGDESKVCMLVIIGVLEEGTKEVNTISDGFRESEQSWTEVLLDLKNKGLEYAPMLAVGDSALGFGNVLRKIFPTTKEQRCWFHKQDNVLTQLPDSLQGQGLQMLREIEQQPTRAIAIKPMKHQL
jgi:transposase-like protein